MAGTYTVVPHLNEDGRFNVLAPEGFLCCVRGVSEITAKKIAKFSNLELLHKTKEAS